ncbi:unnamed protein product [Schistosoma turkestanicum]|nr:unnamed protein product [Schistosoma turkestanicum]
MFCVVGAQFDPSRIIYHGSTHITTTTTSTTTTTTNHNHSKSMMKPGDIILAIDGYELSGYTKRDAITLCNACLQSHSHVRLHLSPPHALVTSSTMLSSFLATSFAMDSSEYALQEKIRENVYQRVVPCTTRLPRAEEIDGVHYRFMNVPQFLALERSGQLLESGMYKGNHYGTPRPDPDSTALDPAFLEQFQLSSTDISQISDDACRIPPPLAPLSSLNRFGLHTTTSTAPGTNGNNNTTTTVTTTTTTTTISSSSIHSSSSTSTCSSSNNSIGIKFNDSSLQQQQQQLPTCSPPPPPPIRNSSITKNSNLICHTTSNLLNLCTTEKNYLIQTMDTIDTSIQNNNNNQHLNEFNSKLYLPLPKFSNDTESDLWSPNEIQLIHDQQTTLMSTTSTMTTSTTTTTTTTNTATITTATTTTTTSSSSSITNSHTMPPTSSHVNTSSMINGCSLIDNVSIFYI